MPAPLLIPIPEPGFVAPELGRAAEFVRDFLERELAGPGRVAAGVQYIQPAVTDRADPDSTFTIGEEWPVRLADIHRCVGPAPYVGPPFVYEWRVAIDHATGRPVAASKAFARYLPEPY